MPVLRVIDNHIAELRYRSLRRKVLGSLALLLALLILCAGGLFVLDEEPDLDAGRRLFKSVWNALNTVSTMGDLTELNQAQKTFLMLTLIGTIGLGSYAIGSLTGLLTGVDMMALRESKRMRKEMESLSGHVIVVGYSAVGGRVARGLRGRGEVVVAIDRNQEAISVAAADGMLPVLGDPSTESALEAARVRTAKAMVVAMSGAPDIAVGTVLLARGANPKLFIRAIAPADAARPWLLRAGADEVIEVDDIVADAILRGFAAGAVPAAGAASTPVVS